MKQNSGRAVLKISDLSIWRSNTEILKSVSWTIHRGEHWVVLGSNGSGKTSLLSALMGYLTPSSGEIELLGKRYGETDWSHLRRKIGMVSSAVRQMMSDSEPALYSVASGKYAMIDFWGNPSGKDLLAAKRILRQVECEYLVDRPWAVLSQGERQRVLIGRALMAKPSILILDESCAGLDPVARENFLQFVERLARKRGAPAIVFVTHHVEEIRPVFSHALLLREGQVLASGPRTEILNNKNLGRVFGARVRLVRSGRGFGLHVQTQSNFVA